MSSQQSPTVVLSLDAELIWGYLDVFEDRSYAAHFPAAVEAYNFVLQRLCAAGISATWAVVGGLCLSGAAGPDDARFTGLPRSWIGRVPAGSEASRPLWYQRAFIERLRQARPAQDIGLHGGLTHLIWTDQRAEREVCRTELNGGVQALAALDIQPRSFVFPRSERAHLELIRSAGFRCYRGAAPVLSERLPRNYLRSAVRALEELGRRTPPPVWPEETLPGLWNIPTSLSLYPVGRYRTRAVPIQTRLERFRRGLAAAIMTRGLFHFWLHPENLCESAGGFALFDSFLEEIMRAREAGDVEVLTMAEMAERMQAGAAARYPLTHALAPARSTRVAQGNG